MIDRTCIEKCAKLVYDEVELAIDEGNPPFAAVIVDENGRVVARTHNQASSRNMAIAHAELEASQAACIALKQKN